MSMERQTVRLEGGPLNGQTWLVHPTARLFTEEFQIGVKQQKYGGVTVDVPQLDEASYRRVSDDRFVFCPTQTAMGDPNPDFYKEEESSMSETVETPQPEQSAQPETVPPAPSVPPVQQPTEEPDTTETETETETTEETEGEVEF